MEGRTYSSSDVYARNASEELFVRSMMESSVGISAAQTMEMLGFKNNNFLMSQPFRTDSEELFKSWLNNGENNHGPRRQGSRRISTELASLMNQSGSMIQKRTNEGNILLRQNSSVNDFDSSNEPNTNRAAANDIQLHASNLFLAKAWFHSSQPMTRSRSSELRRRYVAMQSSQTPIGFESMHHEAPDSNFRQESKDASNGFDNIINNNNNHPIFETPKDALVSPSNSSSSMDNISSVVNMLKGTLERKKQLANKEEAIDDNSYTYSHNTTSTAPEAFLHHAADIMNHTNTYQNNNPLENRSGFGFREAQVLQTIEESLMEGIVDTINNNNYKNSGNNVIATLSREPSQSESSAAPVLVSNGGGLYQMCDDPCVVSMHAPSVCESSRNRIPDKKFSRAKDTKQQAYGNFKEDQKKGKLISSGSVTSAGSADRGDPTKKRRVERSRKMAEAKERSSSTAVPSDTQALLKQCENLEKEVRSLKLNLAFMNRKDSEQTKQIEELEKDKEELVEEKEKLLEELERIIGPSGNII